MKDRLWLRAFLAVAVVVAVLGSIGVCVWKDRSWTYWPSKPASHQLTAYGYSFPQLAGPHAEHTADTFILLDEKGQQKGRFTVPVGALVPDTSLPPSTLKFVPGEKSGRNGFGGRVYYNYNNRTQNEEQRGSHSGGVIAF